MAKEKYTNATLAGKYLNIVRKKVIYASPTSSKLVNKNFYYSMAEKIKKARIDISKLYKRDGNLSKLSIKRMGPTTRGLLERILSKEFGKHLKEEKDNANCKKQEKEKIPFLIKLSRNY